MFETSYDGLKDRLHWLDHKPNVTRSHLRVNAASIGSSTTVMSEVSSAKRNILPKNVIQVNHKYIQGTIVVPKWNIGEPLPGVRSLIRAVTVKNHTLLMLSQVGLILDQFTMLVETPRHESLYNNP